MWRPRLEMGNSGTACRLLMGVVASHPLTAVFSGDSSLLGRPMGRVITPLQQMGAEISARDGGHLPLTIKGTADPLPISYRLPVPSAQVKSAVLLAGLNTPGRTTVIEPQATRDHTERMMAHFGCPAEIAEFEDEEGSGLSITVNGEQELTGREVGVPGDLSSAAFALVAALINPGSEVRIENAGVNPLRGGLLKTLTEMGADLVLENSREDCGEPVADIVARPGSLKGIEIPARRAPSMIDEYPILAVAAAFAEGRTVMHGLGELRVKESDRLAAIAAGLQAAGVNAEVDGDSLIVMGVGGSDDSIGPAGGCQVESHGDHRIAMAFLVLGTAARAGVAVSDSHMIETSFPDFRGFMRGLGAKIEEAGT